jgi:general secretion pathway protein D
VYWRVAKIHSTQNRFLHNPILSCVPRLQQILNPLNRRFASHTRRGRKSDFRFPLTTSTWQRKFTAASLVVSLGIFTCVPQAIADDTSHSATPPPVSTAPTVSAGDPTSVPLPSAQQAAKAREYFHKGTHALKAQDSSQALTLFAKAHLLDPTNGPYLAAYELARQQWVGNMIHSANQDQQAGKTTAAKQQLEQALSLDPDNPFVQEHIQSLTSQDEPAVIESVPMPKFSSGLIELAPAQIQSTFHLRGNAQDVLKKVISAYGITAILDDSVPTKPVQLDLDHASFAEAYAAAELATGTFWVALDPTHVLVAKDSRENRAKFDRLLLETIFLPGLDKTELVNTVNMVRNVFGVRQISSHADQGTVTIRANESTLRAINATVERLYLDKPEVMLDVRVYQVNDSRQQDLGVAFPQQLNVFNVTSQLTSIINSNQSTITELIAAGLVNPGDLAGIAALLIGLGLVNGTVLNQPFALFGNGLTLSGLSFGSTTVNASLNISDTREIDHVELHAGDLQKQTVKIGERYPIVTQSYSAGTQTPTSNTTLASLLAGTSATAAASTNPIALAPTVEYQDLGLTVNTLPRILQNKDVQMQLQVTLASLAGTSVNGSPIINNRDFVTTIQIPDGGTALVTSAVSSTESKSLSGIPGLSELPGFSWTASPTTQVTSGRLLIVISPHIISATHTRIASKMLFLPHGDTGQQD